ncbi:hypothetical protein ALC57_06312 [Trachymyrmex cornetzi]|uniref:Uncharacterized protein n=1 Tax=Trachymyrmex cornetzi TaxID=471704 RepID=A0A195E8E7_9HYME|nr:hypothetical protein ALC57_06312 [Trachymyrmex cornetzi]
MARPGVTGVRCWRVYHGRVHGATRRFLEAIKPHEVGTKGDKERTKERKKERERWHSCAEIERIVAVLSNNFKKRLLEQTRSGVHDLG